MIFSIQDINKIGLYVFGTRHLNKIYVHIHSTLLSLCGESPTVTGGLLSISDTDAGKVSI